jgi:hypothetical protein
VYASFSSHDLATLRATIDPLKSSTVPDYQGECINQLLDAIPDTNPTRSIAQPPGDASQPPR